MSIFGPKIDYLLQNPPNWWERDRDSVLNIYFDENSFTEPERLEIKIALSLISNADLSILEKKIRSWMNPLQVAVEIVGAVRLQYWNIFPN